MLYRKAYNEIKEFYNATNNHALLVTGARQIGKTFLIEQFGKENYDCFLKIDFIMQPSAVNLFSGVESVDEILLRINSLSSTDLIKGNTLIFFDEVQEFPEIVTQIKYLVQDGTFDYILSGSLLGVELNDIRSQPVGYMGVLEMFPMDFEEFALANGVSQSIIDAIKISFTNKTKMDEFIHEKLIKLFRIYTIVGGMPGVVANFIENNDIRKVIIEQETIIALYKKDISKYDKNNKLYINEIFNLIPSELNNKNKRFILKKLNEHFKLSRHENSFIWLKEAGVALPTYNAEEPLLPLALSKSSNLFKLFMNDVGLLTAMYADGLQLKMLSGELNINYGAIYENVVAQELTAHGYNLYYFNNKKQGEIDFLIEDSNYVLPIEVKSGKDYKRHTALNNVLNNQRYGINQGYILCDRNVEIADKKTYLPIYMLMCINRVKLPDKMIYKPDLEGLTF